MMFGEAEKEVIGGSKILYEISKSDCYDFLSNVIKSPKECN